MYFGNLLGMAEYRQQYQFKSMLRKTGKNWETHNKCFDQSSLIETIFGLDNKVLISYVREKYPI